MRVAINCDADRHDTGLEWFSSQSTQLEDYDSTIFPAGPDVPGQAQSRKKYQEILSELKGFDWWADYLWLVRRGWDWRKAILIAWEASPYEGRVPATQEELATQILGLASDRVIATWRKKQPEMEEEIALLQAAPLLRHRRDIFEALATSAKNPDPKSHPDRKLAFEMMGDYKPRQVQEMANVDGEALVIQHKLSAELDRMIEQVYGSKPSDETTD